MGHVWFEKSKNPFPEGTPLQEYKGYVTSDEWGNVETSLAKNIVNRCNPIYIDFKKAIRLLDDYEKINGYPLHEGQRNAALKCVSSTMSVLTGGPGTVKTTVLKAVAYVIRGLNNCPRITYLAPTGKAARRISEQTGESAATVDSVLRLYDETATPQRLSSSVVFVDESSMLDQKKANDLVLSFTGRLIFVGDIDQLPSVGEGAVLRDVIASGVVPVAQLTKTFRQDNSSVLFDAIQHIRNEDIHLPSGEDFKNLPFDKDKFIETYVKKVEQYGINNINVLLPARRAGEYCCNKLNPILKESLIKEYSIDGLQEGDFVMQLRNIDEASNGNIGRVVKAENNNIVVKFDDGFVKYNDEAAKEQLSLAYANTIHKSQGSEYPCVIILCLNEHKRQLNKALLYTGVTRAKKECIVFYEDEALAKSMKEDEDPARTFLTEKLKIEYAKRVQKEKEEILNEYSD